MEYNSESKSNLGKSTCVEGVYVSSLKSNTYNSTKQKSGYVVFQPNGDSYNALVEDDIGYDISNIQLSDERQTDRPDNKSDAHTRSNMKRDMFDVGSHPINHFFVGSITVIGLLVLYRFLHKNK
jgi:hypothetical protein